MRPNQGDASGRHSHGMGPRTRPLGDSDLIDLAYLPRLGGERRGKESS